jgi:hypothetical protein
MRETHTPDSLKLRRQPPASMSSTSSQYYRSANTHSHYPNFPANNHDLYALATSWQQDPNGDPSYTGPPSAPFLHYAQGGLDSAPHQSSTPQAWPAGYAREELQSWHQPGGNPSFASRPAVNYDAVMGSASVPQPTPVASRQYQHQQTLDTRHKIPLNTPSTACRSAQRIHDLRISSVGVQKMLCLPLTCD